MLEFIVLGKVPGFEIYLPFGITLLLVVISLSSVFAFIYKNTLLFRNYKQRLQQIFDTSL